MTPAATDREIADLIARLYAKFGKDLSNYRLNTLKRRISLRMAALRMQSMDEYISYLNSEPEEIESLLDSVTIHVTEFFRDPDVFDSIAKRVLPEILERKKLVSESAIRIWSAGCATGEEAYSLAIVSLEFVRVNNAGITVEIYGTDISKEACRIARQGIYDRGRLGKIPIALRERYLEPHPAGFRVNSQLRRTVHFAVNDLFKDPPYSGLDAIVCRNVIIHFDNAVRNEVLMRFYRALSPAGLLVLGKSEAITGSAASRFDLVDARTKIYRRRCPALP